MTIARKPDDANDQHADRRVTGTGDPLLRLLPPPVSNGASNAQVLAQLQALQARLATLPEIEQAKGALMLAYGLTSNDAFTLLRRYSQDRNVKIRVIAARLAQNLGTGPRAAAARHMGQLLDNATDPTPRPHHPPDADGGGSGSGDVPRGSSGPADERA